MRTTRAVPVSCLVAALAAASPCAAQQPSPPAKPVVEAMTEKARQLFADGVKAYQRSRWAEAHAAFLAAWALSKHYSIAGNLADCELKLGLYRDAAEHFARYVREMAKDAGSTPQERKDGDARFAQAKAKVGQADVQVSVADAEVYLDGKSIGAAPLTEPTFLDPGPHVFEARHDGYVTARVTFTATAGTEQPVVLTLARASVEAPPPPAKPGWRPGPALLVTGGVLAAGGLAAGIGLTVAANRKSADADTIGARLGGPSTCTGTPATSVASDCTSVKDALTAQGRFSNAAVGAFVVGGALGLATAGLGVWSARSKDASTGVRVTPVVSAREGGVVVMGAW